VPIERQIDIHKGEALIALALVLSVLCGYVDLHTDDMFILVGLIAGSALVLGFLQPRAAWRWGVLVGLGAPVAEAVAAAGKIAAPYAPPSQPLSVQAPALLLIFAVTTSIALGGAYGGVLLRRTLAAGSSDRSTR
jgi:hypothetical protein